MIVDEHHLLARYRYSQLDPARAAMAKHSREYRWSSYGANAYGKIDLPITAHEQDLALSTNPQDRQHAYWARIDSRTRLSSSYKGTSGRTSPADSDSGLTMS